MKMTRKHLYAVFCLSVCMLTTFAVAEKSQQPLLGSDELVSHTLIRQAGWTYNWQVNLPIKPKESIDTIGVMGGSLYVLTDTNLLFCIDRKAGRVRYATQLSVSQLPVCKPLFYDEKFWFIVGSEMLVFDPKIGQITLRKNFGEIGNTFECGLSRNSDHIYITGSDRRLHVYNLDGFWHEFSASADNDTPIISTLANDEIVVFATQQGNIVGMNPNEAEKYWQFDATGQIKNQLKMDENFVYAGSMDSKLYKLDIKSGKLAWHSPFHSGAPVKDPFYLGHDIIYLHNSLNGLYGVSKETGEAVWQVLNGQSMICETEQKAFIYAAPGILKVMNNVDGKEMYSVNFSQVQLYANNTVDSIMYLADAKGRLMSVTVK